MKIAFCAVRAQLQLVQMISKLFSLGSNWLIRVIMIVLSLVIHVTLFSLNALEEESSWTFRAPYQFK